MRVASNGIHHARDHARPTATWPRSGPEGEPGLAEVAEPETPPFVHLDVQSCYSLYRSPSTPEEYAAALAAQHRRTPADARIDPRGRAIALADYGLHSAVKMAVACRKHGLQHIPALRVRVVPERAYRPWNEHAGELILLAADDVGWLNLTALTNLGHVVGWGGRPRVDWHDLASHADGLICLTGGPATGLLAPHFQSAPDDASQAAAKAAAQQLADVYPGRLYLELAYLGYATDKLVNLRLISLAERLDLPLVATNAVRFATREKALAQHLLDVIAAGQQSPGSGARAGISAGRAREDDRGEDVATLGIEALRSRASLRTAAEMWRLFGQCPEALLATEEIARRCEFRLPLAEDTAPERRYSAAYFFPEAIRRREDASVHLRQVAREGLAERYRDTERYCDTERGAPPGAVQERLSEELALISAHGLQELLLAGQEIAAHCAAAQIPLRARGSTTSSLVAWSLGLVDLSPVDYALPSTTFLYRGRPDAPDLDLEVAAGRETAVRGALLRPLPPASLPSPATAGYALASELPHVGALRVGAQLAIGSRNAVRHVGQALGVRAGAVHALARLVPLLSGQGAVEGVLAGGTAQSGANISPNVEPYTTLLEVAAQIETLPQRLGAHPTGLVVAAGASCQATPGLSTTIPGLLHWLPAQWVGSEGPAGGNEPPTDAGAGNAPSTRRSAVTAGGPALASQWDKDDLTALGIGKIDLSASAGLSCVAAAAQPSTGDGARAPGSPMDPLRDQAARDGACHLLTDGETLCISFLEPWGVRTLLQRLRDAHAAAGAPGYAVAMVEDLAQVLALRRPGVYSSEREGAYVEAKYGSPPPYAHPSMGSVLDPTHGQLLYAEQLIDLVKLLGVGHAEAVRFCRLLNGGDYAARERLELRLRTAAAQRGWREAEVNGLLKLVAAHHGYLFNHGHALTYAATAFRQAALKANPQTAPAFFAGVLNTGGSSYYGLGMAVEEARRCGIALLPPCVNRSQARYVVERAEDGRAGIRVPLSAIRGLGRRVAGHVLAARTAFGEFDSLFDFLAKVDHQIVTRADLLLLVKLGAFAFTGISRAGLTLAEQIFSASAALARSHDHAPHAAPRADDGLIAGAAPYLALDEWPPETLAALDLAYLGFYTSASMGAAWEPTRQPERSGAGADAISIAELIDYPDRAPVAVVALITACRVRQTRKGERMAWITLADATGAIECAVFPAAYIRVAQTSVLRQGNLVAASGRLSQERGGPPKLFVDGIHTAGTPASRWSALTVSLSS